MRSKEMYLSMTFTDDGNGYKIFVDEDEEYTPDEFDVMVKDMGPPEKLIFEDFADARRVFEKSKIDGT